MNSNTHLEMHRDHRDWEMETNFWRDDLRAWQKELTQARAEMQTLQNIFAERERQLCAHGSVIRLHATEAEDHEHQIAVLERGDASTGEHLIKTSHADEAAQHLADRASHEKIKRHHHEFITRWRLLLFALSNLD